MNTELRKNAKNDFEKDFLKLINNYVFGKTMENVRKHRDIKLVNTDAKRNKLVSEINYHTTKWFSEKLLAIEMKKAKVKMNKPIYLGLSILEISKTLMHEFWYDYMKPKYGDNVKLCYMDADNFIMHIKTEDFYKDIANDYEILGFIKFKGPLHIFKSIHNGDIPLEDIEKEQIELKNDLGRIKEGDPRDKSEEQKKTTDNIKNLYNSREEVGKMFNDYTRDICLEIFMIQSKKEQDLNY